MSQIKVNFEIGHVASLRSKKTADGFTHDWEVFVRGQEGADISHFVDKVVFNLHETFPKPRRVFKEPPFAIKESGYAGFPFPIDIYLKNQDEPKKITFYYDLSLQENGILKDRYIFQNPNEDFRKKLLKGGGILVSNNTFYTNPDQESKSRDSFTEEKQLLNKHKLSSENVKKHKVKEHKEEIPHRANSFENLFGPPIQKTFKISPDPKKLEKIAPQPKSDKKEKERGSTDKKSKHEHKVSKSDKVRSKEDKEKTKTDKSKSHSKDQDKIKEKSSKKPNERSFTPEQPKKRCVSPVRKLTSPPPRSSSASSMKEEYKIQKQSTDSELRKSKTDDKPIEAKIDKEKKKKEKKSHDRDKERKEKKESKKESQKLKELPVNKEPPKEIPKEVPKHRETPKEIIKEVAFVKEKQPKLEKPINKFSLEYLRKSPAPENEEKTNHHRSKEKPESERKHKHKKKDKKRDESREKHKDSSKEKKHKYEKVCENIQPEKPEIVERRETPVPKERAPELASPISLDTASQCSSKSGAAKTSQIHDDINSSHSDSESSVIAEEDVKPKIIVIPSPEPIKHEPSSEPEPEPEPEPEVEQELEPEPVAEPQHPQLKEKSKKHKDKSKREEKRRKRKAADEEDAENRKVAKLAETAPSNTEPERGESSGSVTETKVQDNGVSSSLGEDAEPGDLSPDYMVQLRDLQKRIMRIKNNEDLERVVNLIAETGRYEVTTQTFDFDLCLLDRSTVQQLLQLVGC